MITNFLPVAHFPSPARNTLPFSVSPYLGHCEEGSVVFPCKPLRVM
ncbi:hypothetical protein E2C01_094964 [Portunus trituberculatus]|uniref:Uncharacterized protein n=1 Tax=Portunus trituberculatus TaxID=210409 RepID=A0A5B7K4J0_PORTR|nr:hypothetical protein [Portunus trituberculatus]